MKHRWLACLLCVVALTLAACTPAEGGGDDPETLTPAPADFYDDY